MTTLKNTIAMLGQAAKNASSTEEQLRQVQQGACGETPTARLLERRALTLLIQAGALREAIATLKLDLE